MRGRRRGRPLQCFQYSDFKDSSQLNSQTVCCSTANRLETNQFGRRRPWRKWQGSASRHGVRPSLGPCRQTATNWSVYAASSKSRSRRRNSLHLMRMLRSAAHTSRSVRRHWSSPCALVVGSGSPVRRLLCRMTPLNTAGGRHAFRPARSTMPVATARRRGVTFGVRGSRYAGSTVRTGVRRVGTPSSRSTIPARSHPRHVLVEVADAASSITSPP
jgi:hypothetical protein